MLVGTMSVNARMLLHSSNGGAVIAARDSIFREENGETCRHYGL